MKLKTVLLVLALPACAWLGRAQTVIPATTYSGPSPVVISSADPAGVTTNSNAVTVASGATVTFHSTVKIKLEPGFHAASGANFFAMIGAGPDTDGDGIPDLWEVAHGLNPSNAADAQNATSGGLTYLLEYQLGTNPATAKQSDTDNTTTGLKVHHPL